MWMHCYQFLKNSVAHKNCSTSTPLQPPTKTSVLLSEMFQSPNESSNKVFSSLTSPDSGVHCLVTAGEEHNVKIICL